MYTKFCLAILSKQFNGFNYFYLTQIILFNINHLFAYREVVKSITNEFIAMGITLLLLLLLSLLLLLLLLGFWFKF